MTDKDLHRKQELDDHMERLQHAGTVMREHKTDLADTFDAAWLSFTRPVIRLAFASGVDVSSVRWHTTNPDAQREPEEVMHFLLDAIEADRQCDLASLQGPLYVVSPEVHLVVCACAASLSFREIAEAFTHDELPAPSGMVILPDRAPWVTLPHTRAMTWHRLPQSYWGEARDHVIPAIRCKAYAHSAMFHHMRISGHRIGVTKPDVLLYNGIRDVEPCFGDLDPGHASRVEAWMSEAMQMRSDYEDLMSSADDIGRQAGEPVGEARFDRAPAKPLTLSSYFAALSRVLDQEIAVADPADRQDAPRGPHHNATKPEPDIQIVRLRRASTADGTETKTVNWSHRWVVQMHKVRQWYPSLDRHKTIWRGPYIKGPAGAPLKAPRERIHAVIR